VYKFKFVCESVDKVVPILSYGPHREGMWGSGEIAPIILPICTIWRRVISFTPMTALAPSKETRSSLSSSRSGSLKEEKTPLLLAVVEPRFLCRPVCSQVPKRAELSRIFIFYINISSQIPNARLHTHSAARRGDTAPKFPHLSKITLGLHCIKRR